ncbi:MAG TPA: DUF2637 domain-containing protein [Trebonia sp.]|jgi:hypothetical protein
MNSPHQAPLAPRRNWTRRLVNLLVALVVIVVAAATFVFSYDGVHAIALLGGVSTQLARYYPGLFDAVLVIACVAAVMLRDGRWWARLWAWVVIIVVLGAIGVTDVLHATSYTLRHRPTEGIVAAAPIVAVLLAFSLLITLLRQSRTQPAPSAAPPTVPLPVDEIPALPAAASVPPMALPAAPVTPATVTPATATPVPVTPVPANVPEDGPVPEAVPAPAQAEPPLADAAEVDTEAKPSDEPAPPTVQVPALAPERPARPQGIRYAGNGVPGMAGNPRPAEPAAPPTAAAEPLPDDYWDTEEAGQFAGLVYAARDEDGADLNDAAEGNAADDAEDADEGPAPDKTPPDLDDDAPPFATAPFASVPRLNRVRSTPTPPADEDE